MSTLVPNQVLKQHSIRRTNCRVDVLGEFITAQHALSQPDLERAIGEEYDRVTIYRTLTLYLEKCIIHKVLDDSGAMRYALCREECSTHAHDHVHFKCVVCGNTNCIESVQVPAIQLPAGYQLQEINLLMSGVCKDCG
ncbi:MAG: transcriptional repressor [Bacteroidota bacterium]